MRRPVALPLARGRRNLRERRHPARRDGTCLDRRRAEALKAPRHRADAVTWRSSRVDGVAAPTDVLVRGRNKGHSYASRSGAGFARCSSATSSRNNLLQQKRPRQFSPAAYPHKRRVCAATGSILLPSPQGREHLAPLDCRRRAVRVQRRHSDRLGRQLLPARRPRDQPCRYASARDGRRASRVARAPSSAATQCRQGAVPSVARGHRDICIAAAQQFLRYRSLTHAI